MPRQRPPLDIETMVRDPDWLNDRDISPLQVGILKAIYGLPLEKEQLEAFVEVTEGRKPRRGGYFETTIVAGVRSGKTEKIGSNVMLYQAITFDRARAGMAPGEIPYIGIVAQDLGGTSQVFGYVEGKARLLEEKGWPVLNHGKAQERAVTGKEIRFTSGVVVQCFPAKKASTRNKTMIGGLGDELAWWETEDVAVNADYEICRALRQRMTTLRKWAKFVKHSSPYMEHGVLWDDYQDRLNPRSRRLFIHAPSWVLNPNIDKRVLEEAQADDPEGYLRDYGAQFGKAGGSFLTASEVDSCMRVDRAQILSHDETLVHEAALDAGFKRDRFVLGIGRRDGDRLVFPLIRWWTPEKGRPLDDKEVAREVAELLQAYGLDTVEGDPYGDVQFGNDLARYGVRLLTAAKSEEGNFAMFQNLKKCLRRGLLELPRDETIRKDLLALRKMGSGNKVKIKAPDRKGFYDDISNVLARLTMKLLPAGSNVDLELINSGSMSDLDQLYRKRGLPVPEREDRLPTDIMAQIY